MLRHSGIGFETEAKQMLGMHEEAKRATRNLWIREVVINCRFFFYMDMKGRTLEIRTQHQDTAAAYAVRIWRRTVSAGLEDNGIDLSGIHMEIASSSL